MRNNKKSLNFPKYPLGVPSCCSSLFLFQFVSKPFILKVLTKFWLNSNQSVNLLNFSSNLSMHESTRLNRRAFLINRICSALPHYCESILIFMHPLIPDILFWCYFHSNNRIKNYNVLYRWFSLINSFYHAIRGNKGNFKFSKICCIRRFAVGGAFSIGWFI